MRVEEEGREIRVLRRSNSALTKFQAYSREFDPLNSIDVDEEILDLFWPKPQANYLKLLTMNCKGIKLWKLLEKAEKKMASSTGKELTIPKMHAVENNVSAVLQ